MSTLFEGRVKNQTLKRLVDFFYVYDDLIEQKWVIKGGKGWGLIKSDVITTEICVRQIWTCKIWGNRIIQIFKPNYIARAKYRITEI